MGSSLGGSSLTGFLGAKFLGSGSWPEDDMLILIATVFEIQ